MYVIENTANGRYYRKLGAEAHQYTDIRYATPFSKWKKAKQKADILHAAISPIGEQINFEVKQHKFYVLKNRNDGRIRDYKARSRKRRKHFYF